MSSTYCKHGILRIKVPGREQPVCNTCRNVALGEAAVKAWPRNNECGDEEVLSRGNPPTRLAARNNAKTRIDLERHRQIKLWGDGPLPKALRLAVLTEELGEVAKAMQDETDKELLAELSQVAAVALRWMEDLLLEMDR